MDFETAVFHWEGHYQTDRGKRYVLQNESISYYEYLGPSDFSNYGHYLIPAAAGKAHGRKMESLIWLCGIHDKNRNRMVYTHKSVCNRAVLFLYNGSSYRKQ